MLARLAWHAGNNGAVRFTVDDTAYGTSVVAPRERAGANDLDAACAEGAALPTEEAARRIRCSFSFRDRRTICRGVGDHVAAPRQGHTGRRRRGGRRGNDDPMIRKIRSAVAILLSLQPQRHPL
jgi:hypothetical protein